ncbi:hypothetical protein HAX54_028691 [Datura stramonium]|uniref:Uncharacterized protein n=1 Tax=Datura stramonium TaxID=4076 RepID=A0ABS8S9R0_DATST|nr:hypothetical protein [Datura stramonium]
MSQKFGQSLVSSFGSGLGTTGCHMSLTGIVKDRAEAGRRIKEQNALNIEDGHESKIISFFPKMLHVEVFMVKIILLKL